MTISSGATDGIEVEDAAMHENTLASQAQANGVDEIVFTDDLATVNNGDITAPSGFVGRMCVLRWQTGTEETRFIVAETAGTGNTIIATVGEPWVIAPTSSDTVYISYSSDDMEAFIGMTIAVISGIYEGGTAREWQSGLGTNPAYVAVVGYIP